MLPLSPAILPTMASVDERLHTLSTLSGFQRPASGVVGQRHRRETAGLAWPPTTHPLGSPRPGPGFRYLIPTGKFQIF